MKILLALALLLVSVSVHGEEYFVAMDGSDSDDGLDSVDAFLTVGHALTAVGDNDTITVTQGWYTEGGLWFDANQTLWLRGTSAAPGHSVISGGSVATTWTQVDVGDTTFFSTEFTTVRDSGVFYDTLTMMVQAANKAAALAGAGRGSWYFDDTNDTLFFHGVANADPDAHSVEVSTESDGFLARWGTMTNDSVHLADLEFNLCTGVPLQFRDGGALATGAPDSMSIHNCIIRSNTVAAVGPLDASGLQISYLSTCGTGMDAAPHKGFYMDSTIFFANYQRTGASGLVYNDFPGKTTWKHCWFGNHTLMGYDDHFTIEDQCKDEATFDYSFDAISCLFYNIRESSFGGGHAAIGNSIELGRYDSCLFIRCVNGIDGTLTFLDSDSSHVSSCVFVADSATAVGAISATLSSVHPGGGDDSVHALYVTGTRIIDCFAENTSGDASVGIFAYDSDGSPDSQMVYWTNSVIQGAPEGHAMTWMDSILIRVGAHSGDTTYGVTDANDYFFKNATGGSDVSCFGNSSSFQYDTTTDVLDTEVDQTYEDAALSSLNSIGNDLTTMGAIFQTYWDSRAAVVRNKVMIRR